MNYQSLLNSKKSLKVAFLVAIFGAVLFFGIFAGQYAANGEESVSILTEEPVFAGYDSTLDTAECIDEELYGNCDEIEVPYDLENEKTTYTATETRPQINWQKNAVSLGNFTPDMIYVLEDAGSKFTIAETEAIAADDGEINLVAFGMDENDNDFYTFHMAYKAGGNDWKAAFVDFVTNFKN